MSAFEEKISTIAQQVHDENVSSDQFAVAQVPFHTHNGSDSPKISFGDLIERIEFVNINLPGFLGQTGNNWGVIFTAPFACNFIGATEIHQTAESTATTMTVQIEKLFGTQASGAGRTLLFPPFDLKAAANTRQTAILNQSSNNTSNHVFNLQPGDRLGLVLTTTGSAPATLVGVNIVIQLQF